ncbi:DUF4328 domain-containing protein [Streptomyces sp. NPDC052040]|uniref:DUF4328 domain-containing protein n=1 Tax=unclassified Streptomyces TaxID=2593676 RepID=UPI0037CDCA3D
MTCARCLHGAAAPGGTLCAQCASATAPATQPYTPQPYPPVPAALLRSPVGLGRATAALLGLVAATDLFSIAAETVRYDVTGDLVAGDTSAALTRRAHHADVLTAVAGTAQITALLACVVVYLCWFYRVRVNAEVFEPSGHELKRGWAIGGWFTPIVNLWFPRRIALNIWDASGPSGAPRPHGLVNAWWTLWIVSQLAGRASFQTDRGAHTVSGMHAAAPLSFLADGLDLAAALLAILVVLRLTRMQNEKALRGPEPLTGPVTV